MFSLYFCENADDVPVKKLSLHFSSLATNEERSHVTEERIVSLDKEKSSITKDLEDARKELEQQKLKIEQILYEKTELESAKLQGDNEIVKLDAQLTVSKDKISSLEMSSATQVEKIKQLEGEVCTYKA
nr:putative leucine-rich repeat-containing protein [Tanacetum cinerariifolium]